MSVYPTPRLLILLSLGFPLAIAAGIFAPAVWLWVPVVMGVVLLLALVDGALAPVGGALSFALTLPKAIGVGRDHDVPFTARFNRWRQPRQLEVRLDLNAVLAASTWDRVLKRENDAFSGTLHLSPKSRGPGSVEAAWLRWQGFMGLVYLQKRLALETAVAVTPDLKGVEQDASALFSLDSIYGIRVQNQLHNGSEYHALREYDSSQDHRRIDWKSSARHMKLYSREYQAERNHHIVLVYDTGRLMGEPLNGLKRIDRAIHAGLLLGYTALKVGDNIRTFAFAARPYHAAPMISGTQGFDILKRQLGSFEDSTEESNHTLALADLNARVGRRSLIILFTDFIDDISAELMLEALNRLGKKHLVLFVAFGDEVVETLQDKRPDSPEDVTRAVFARRLAAKRERVLSALRRMGAEVLEAPTEHLATAIVTRYLALKRSGRL